MTPTVAGIAIATAAIVLVAAWVGNDPAPSTPVAGPPDSSSDANVPVADGGIDAPPPPSDGGSDATPPPPANLLVDLFAYWPFELSLTDVLGNKTLVVSGGGMGAFASDSKLGSSAVVLDGTKSLAYAHSPSDTAFDLASDATFQMWAKEIGAPESAQRGLFGKPSQLTNAGWDVHIGGPNIVLNVRNTDMQAAVSSFGGVWRHVVVRRSGAMTEVFIDGMSSLQRTDPAPVALNIPFVVGLRYPANNEWFKGNLDELAIWKRALTNDEILQLFNAGAGVALR